MSPTMPISCTRSDRARAQPGPAGGRPRAALLAAAVAGLLFGPPTGSAVAQGDDPGASVPVTETTGELCTLRFLPGRERLFDCRIEAGWGPTLLTLWVDRSIPAPTGWIAADRLQLSRLDADNDFERYVVEDRPLESGLVSVLDDRIRGFALEDMNFDGYLDFRLVRSLPDDGNYRYQVWLYDVGRDAFLRSERLSTLTRPVFDPAAGQVTETVFALPTRVHRTLYDWEGRGTAARLEFRREEACQRTEEDLVYREIDGAVGNRRLPMRRELVAGDTPAAAMARCLDDLDFTLPD